MVDSPSKDFKNYDHTLENDAYLIKMDTIFLQICNSCRDVDIHFKFVTVGINWSLSSIRII